jgi:L-Lysine epsilon oxidase N-terminal
VSRRIMQDDIIVKAAICPSIGIARVGNSLAEWYVGPEVPDPLPQPPGFYRDDTGALKREAARFRVYGLNARGTIVRELTGADADIAWTV